MTEPRATWRIELTLATLDHAAPFERALAGVAAATSLSQGEAPGSWTLAAHADAAPDRAGLTARLAAAAEETGIAVPEVRVTALADTDWVDHVQRRSPPVEAGRFFIHGSHFAGAVPAGRIAIRLDAGAAFGTGGHESTRGCLLALDRLAGRLDPRSALDMGCGSGILAIAIALLWGRGVIACDGDPVAVRVAAENAAANGVADRVTAVRGFGFRNPAVRRRAPFDLAAANILARPLIRMAPALARHLAPRGVVVLSGLLAEQEEAVAAAYRAHGLELADRIALAGWHTLIVEGRRS